MSPERKLALASLAVTVAKRHRDPAGEPQPLDLSIDIAVEIIERLHQVWQQRDAEVHRLRANIDSGIA